MKITTLTLWPSDQTNRETCDSLPPNARQQEMKTGLQDWGEHCPIRTYRPACADGLPSSIIEMASHIPDLRPFGNDAPMRWCDAALHGHQHAETTFDKGPRDLVSQTTQQPHYALRGECRKPDQAAQTPAHRPRPWRAPRPRHPPRALLRTGAPHAQPYLPI